MANWWDTMGTTIGDNLIGMQMPFGMAPPTDPQQRAAMINPMLVNIGATMLANRGKNPAANLGLGLVNAQQAGMDQLGKSLYARQIMGQEEDRRTEKERENRTMSWWQQYHPDLAKKYGPGVTPKEMFSILAAENKPQKPPNWTTFSTGEGVFAMNPENPMQRMKLGPPPSRQSDAPTGYRFAADGKTLEAIPGGPATKMPAEVAGRVAMLDTAERDMPAAEKYFLEGGNSFGNEAMGYAFNAGDYGRAARTVRMAIESGLRAMTGAAAPDSEVRNYENMFLPMPTDTIETRQQKLAALRNFMSQAKVIMEQGRGQTSPLGGQTEDPLGIR